jgi:hypothetical protein
MNDEREVHGGRGSRERMRSSDTNLRAINTPSEAEIWRHRIAPSLVLTSSLMTKGRGGNPPLTHSQLPA